MIAVGILVIVLTTACWLVAIESAMAVGFDVASPFSPDAGPQVMISQPLIDAGFNGSPTAQGSISENNLTNFLPEDGSLSALNSLGVPLDWDLVSAFSSDGSDLIDSRFYGAYTPEPGSVVLLGLGLCGLTILSGRKHEVDRARFAISGPRATGSSEK